MRLLYLVPLFFAGFFAVHILKMLRFYLVLLEQRISIKEFIFLYIRTTFVNLLIPFKLGEVYRAFSVIRFTDCIEVGILSVVLDRFFDTFILLLFLIPYDLLVLGRLTWITICILLFLLAVMMIYRMFEPTYLYLNHYMIQNASTKRGIRMLSVMETLREWYDYTKKLVTGRQYLIVLCSVLGWFAEFGLLWLISGYCEMEFGITEFAAYIQSIFSMHRSVLLKKYSRISMVILLAFLLLFLCVRALRRKGNEKKGVCSV